MDLKLPWFAIITFLAGWVLALIARWIFGLKFTGNQFGFFAIFMWAVVLAFLGVAWLLYFVYLR